MTRRSLPFQHFAQRFTNEYLAPRQECYVYQSKKRRSQDVVTKVCDVVPMHDEYVFRGPWKLAIVKRALRCSDGNVRAAYILTSSGVTNRLLHILCPLEAILTDSKEH